MRSKGFSRAPLTRLTVVGSVAVAVVAVVMLITPAFVRAEVTGAQAVELLNAQRAAAGLPSDIVERPDWSAACAQHNHYQYMTGTFGHSEDPASPYYTAEGDWAAGNSVLSRGGPSWSEENPWETAPIHLFQVLAPSLAQMGASESYGMACATTWPGYSRPHSPELVTYSYPGDGATGVPYAEQANESPFVPGDFVGLPGGTTTGPYLLVYLDGPISEIDSASVSATSLMGPEGPVDLRVVDSTHPQVGPYMPKAGAFVIPIHALRPLTTYQAKVEFNAGSSSPVRSFSFTTRGQEPDDPLEDGGKKKKHRLRIKHPRLRLRATHHGVRITPDPVLVGRSASLVVTRWRRTCWLAPGPPVGDLVRYCAPHRVSRPTHRRIKLRRHTKVWLPRLAHRRYFIVSARTGRFMVGMQRYAAARGEVVVRRMGQRRRVATERVGSQRHSWRAPISASRASRSLRRLTASDYGKPRENELMDLFSVCCRAHQVRVRLP